MNLYKQFGTDKNLEQNGIIFEVGRTDDGKPIQFVIARAGGSNVNFAKEFKRKTDPYRRQIQLKTIDEDLLGDLMREVYASSVVIGWKNVSDADGNELDYTPANCAKLLKDLPDLYSEILQVSENAALFRAQELEADAKN